MTVLGRTLVLMLAGLGTAWAVTRVGGVPPTVYNTLDDTAPVPDEPSQDDIEAQIRRAEEALGDRADPDQELPVEPLRADVAISLPSDI